MRLALSLNSQDRMQAFRSRKAVYGRQISFDRCVRRALACDGPFPDEVIAELYAHWGDPLSPADESFMRSCLSETARCEGPILQCGTSLSTLLLGAICDRNDNPQKNLWCIEHDPHWANLMRSWLTQYSICKAHVFSAKPAMFKGFTWYSVDPKRLPDKLHLVLCEGGRATPRGVVGALQRLEDHLAPGYTVLARGVNNAVDGKFLAAWAKAHGAAVVVVDKNAGFVKIQRKVKPPRSPRLPD